MLKFYNLLPPIKVSCDASEKCLGAVLEQNENDILLHMLVVLDYISNFFNISEIPNKRSSTVVLHTKQIFSRYGISKEVISHNGPESIENVYKKFSKK